MLCYYNNYNGVTAYNNYNGVTAITIIITVLLLLQYYNTIIYGVTVTAITIIITVLLIILQ